MGRSVRKMDDDNSYTSAGVVTLGVVLLIALILVTLYYRRRSKRLKDELAHEQMLIRHFDNPVYAYQGVPPPSTSLNNTGTKHIYNDLGMKSNLNKAKFWEMKIQRLMLVLNKKTRLGRKVNAIQRLDL
ncbi:protein draper [Nephila pilipes]|uniref:Protein draper n=1 Tax=Nephila pilipes TaxID=299642 RepID=A0A8X6QLY6_NEPPI|nr:protein draper [Nephila pilipes]